MDVPCVILVRDKAASNVLVDLLIEGQMSSLGFAQCTFEAVHGIDAHGCVR